MGLTPRHLPVPVAFAMAMAFAAIPLGTAGASTTHGIPWPSIPRTSPTASVARSGDVAGHYHLNCAASAVCTEVQNPEEVFGEDQYVGHDEPSVLFYSSQAGSGNQMTYHLTLPTDPAPTQSGATFNFQLHPAFWFGMAMCATQSYPMQKSTCAPDSDSNIFDGQDSAHPMSQHPGTAFTELQFYPPGWVKWPAGNSCDATEWCAALNIDSLAEDPVNGTAQNASCVDNVIGSPEYVNF